MKCVVRLACVSFFLSPFLGLAAQEPNQPKVAPGPNEPDWAVILKTRYGLKMYDDLVNPVLKTPAETPGLFRKAGPGAVRYTPEIALGLETTTRGGWYTAGKDAASPRKRDLWSYTVKNTTSDLETGKNLPPALAERSTTEFDPGDAPFGLWIANDGLKDGGAFTEPRVVAAVNCAARQATLQGHDLSVSRQGHRQGGPPLLPDRLGILDKRRLSRRRLSGR